MKISRLNDGLDAVIEERTDKNMREAAQIMRSMNSIPGCTGTATAAVIDDLCKSYDTQCILCHGYVMRAEFTPITANIIAYRTVKI